MAVEVNFVETRSDYQVPEEFVTAVLRLFDLRGFSYDLAADKYSSRAAHYYTEEDDALSKTWNSNGGVAWLHPPFADVEPWVRKAYESRRTCETLVLVPASVGSNWYRDWVHGKATVRFLNGRLKFVGCVNPYPKDCILIHYGARDRYADYYVWTWCAGQLGLDI